MDMTASSNSNPTAGTEPAHALAAAVVWSGDGAAKTYPAFATLRSHARGGFLAGRLFLEVEEEVELELSAGGAVVGRARVRVVEIVRGEQPGMVVALVEADEAVRARIAQATS
jgi:hypothetical protein